MRPAAGWLDARDEPLARRLALLPLEPFGWLWCAGARLHRALYAHGLRARGRLPCRVVSVGSVVAGGAGKTPAAAWLAGALARRGHSVVLASGGYGGRRRAAPWVVSDGRFVRGRSETAGDEPLVLAARAPRVPVLAGRDRLQLGWRAIGCFGAEVLVLDDGFQHHRLHRDVDVVLLDGALGLGTRRCLPRGPLREPPAALGRAQLVGIVDGPLAERDSALLDRLAPQAHRFEARRRPLLLRPLGGGAAQAVEGLAGRAVGMLCAVARPASLRRSLEALGARVVAERCFADHHRYRPADLEGLAGEAPLWITTEKDAVKLQRPWAAGADLRVLAVTLEVDAAELLLDHLERCLDRA